MEGIILQDNKREERVKEAIGELVNVPVMIQIAINDICKSRLKKGEVIVFTSFVNGQMMVWIYPVNADLTVAGRLLETCLSQVKNTYAAQIMFKEKEKAERNREQYTA